MHRPWRVGLECLSQTRLEQALAVGHRPWSSAHKLYIMPWLGSPAREGAGTPVGYPRGHLHGRGRLTWGLGPCGKFWGVRKVLGCVASFGLQAAEQQSRLQC